MTHTPSIERSTGTAIAPGLRAGGGYSGATAELDAVVMEAAERLREEYGVDVQVRYNSDRRSGGAWLADGGRGFNAYCTIGITAGYHKVWPEGKMVDYFADKAIWDALPERLVLSVYVKVNALRDPALANCHGSQSYAYIEQPDIEAAMIWLGTNAVLA